MDALTRISPWDQTNSDSEIGLIVVVELRARADVRRHMAGVMEASAQSEGFPTDTPGGDSAGVTECRSAGCSTDACDWLGPRLRCHGVHFSLEICGRRPQNSEPQENGRPQTYCVAT